MLDVLFKDTKIDNLNTYIDRKVISCTYNKSYMSQMRMCKVIITTKGTEY